MAIWGRMVENGFSTRLSLSPTRKGGSIVGAGARGSGRRRGWGGAVEGPRRGRTMSGRWGELGFSPARAFAVRHDGSSRPACRRPQHFFFPPQTLEPIFPFLASAWLEDGNLYFILQLGLPSLIGCSQDQMLVLPSHRHYGNRPR